MYTTKVNLTPKDASIAPRMVNNNPVLLTAAAQPADAQF